MDIQDEQGHFSNLLYFDEGLFPNISWKNYSLKLSEKVYEKEPSLKALKAIAKYYFYSGKYDHLEMLYKKNPAASETETLNLALHYHRTGKLKKADEIYKQILKHFPANYDALHLRGVIAHQLEKHESAFRLIQEAIQISPQAEFYNDLGNVLIKQGKFNEAFTAYQKSIKINPDNLMVRKNLEKALKGVNRTIH